MTIPGFILGTTLGVLSGALFHFWKGGGLFRLLLYAFLGWVGFWIGHIIASSQNFHLLKIGVLNAGLGMIMSIIILGLGHWLSLIQSYKKNS